MEIDEKAIKGLACRALELWINLEATKCRPDSNYQTVIEVLKQRFHTENLNPLLLILGLLEMAIIEDALRNKRYLSDEERERIISDVVESLASKFPEVVKELEKLVDDLENKLKEFKAYASKYGKTPDTEAGGE